VFRTLCKRRKRQRRAAEAFPTHSGRIEGMRTYFQTSFLPHLCDKLVEMALSEIGKTMANLAVEPVSVSRWPGPPVRPHYEVPLSTVRIAMKHKRIEITLVFEIMESPVYGSLIVLIPELCTELAGRGRHFHTAEAFEHLCSSAGHMPAPF